MDCQEEGKKRNDDRREMTEEQAKELKKTQTASLTWLAEIQAMVTVCAGILSEKPASSMASRAMLLVRTCKSRTR